MSRVLTIIRKEYLERVRSKSFMIGTLLGPALMSMFIWLPVMVAGSGGDDERTIGVVDLSGDSFGSFAAALDERGAAHLHLLPVGCEGRQEADCVAELKSMVVDGTVHSGVVIAADFLETGKAVFYNKSVGALVVLDNTLRPALSRALREGRFAAAAVDRDLYGYLTAGSEWSSISLTPEGGEEQQDGDMAVGMAFVLIMIIYIMVIMYGSHTLTAVIEEKNTRMAEVLLASVSPNDLMLGKVLGIGAAGLTQFGIWALTFFALSQRGVTVGEFTLDVGFLTPIILVSFVVFFVLGFFLYATLYAGVGAMCNTVQDSQQFHTPLAMGMVVPMMLLALVLRAPDSTAAVVLSLVPLFAPVLMFMRVCVETPPLWQIVLSWVLMIVSILLSARAAGKLFRVGILMYGASPTWATLLKALRT
ncbi:MAG: ABC transporter permease [Krumholzibacteria bacterium]|nr:ABC transporter permease [Candidatus Krumholzibacteria bacterium]